MLLKGGFFLVLIKWVIPEKLVAIQPFKKLPVDLEHKYS
jgi:hypothetical protein